jgi:hypothetical protein
VIPDCASRRRAPASPAEGSRPVLSEVVKIETFPIEKVDVFLKTLV